MERKQHRDTPIFRGQDRRCLYDQLFAIDSSAVAATQVAFDVTVEHVLREYGRDLNAQAHRQLTKLVNSGSPILKLAFILMVLPQDAALREQAEDSADPSEQEKARAFYRPMAIGLRSILMTAFDEDNSPCLVLSMIKMLFQAWMCCDTQACEEYCDMFSARCARSSEIDAFAKAVVTELVENDPAAAEGKKRGRGGKRIELT